MTARPRDRSDRPEVDPLAAILGAMRVRSALYFRLEARAPWAVEFRPPAQAKFGLVLDGRCELHVEGGPPEALAAGTSFIVADGACFTLRAGARTRAVSCAEVARARRGDVVRIGTRGGAPATLLCGFFEFDAWSGRPLFELLPRVLAVQIGAARTRAMRATLEQLAEETQAPGLGSSVIVSRLADILLVQTIRAFSCEPARATGWLRAAVDPQIGHALRAIHRDPARPWSVGALAKLASMSRSSFAARFTALVGDPPLGYVVRWRMYRAGQLLRDGTASVAEAAALVGYESTGAFSRAFKRVHDVNPAALKRPRAPSR